MKSAFLPLFFLLPLCATAQVDKTLDKIKERGNKIVERGKDYATDKADQIIERYGLDTIDVEGKARKVDSIMDVRYQSKGKFDEEYLQRPQQRFTVKVRTNLSGSGATGSGTWNDDYFHNKLSSGVRFTTNVGISYRGVGLSLSVNPFGWGAKNRDTELRFEVCNNKYGIDLSYQNTRTYSGSLDLGQQSADIHDGLVKSKIFMASGYYAFNNRRFSYPAAFTQSYRQLHSQGSWLVGASFLAGNVKTKTDDVLANPAVKMNLGYLGIGGGYAYNWVINEHWMMHVSALPTLVITSFNNLKVDGEREAIPYGFPYLILTERASLLYDINDSHFLNMAFVAHTTMTPGHLKLKLNYLKWRLSLTYGFRF